MLTKEYKVTKKQVSKVVTSQRLQLVFYIPTFQINSNGISLLWEIAFNLSKLRECDVYVFEKPWGPPTYLPEKYRSLVVDQEIFSKIKDPIVIYPDTESKNPLNADKVVRYLLAKPLSFGDPLIPNSREYVATYSELVLDKNVLDQYYFLNNELDVQKFIDIERKKNLVSIYYGKCRVGENLKNFTGLLSTFDDVEIITRNEPKDQKKLFQIISRSKLLITLDPFSHITLVANILGTPVLFVDPLFYKVFQRFNQKFFGYYIEDDIKQIRKITSLVNMRNISRQTIQEIKRIKRNERKDLSRFVFSIKKHFKNIDNVKYSINNLNRLNNANSQFVEFYSDEWSKRQFFLITDRKRLFIYHLVSNKTLHFIFKIFYPLIKPIYRTLNSAINRSPKKHDDSDNTRSSSDKNTKFNKFLLNIFWRL